MKKLLNQMTNEEIKEAVIQRYGEVAAKPSGRFNFPVGRTFAESVGYPPEILDKLPHTLWESFTGAGNPQSFVDIEAGEVILDLGCGAGLDLYFYLQKTGPKGKVYGLDLSSEMIAKARRNINTLDVRNVEFLCAPADKIPLPNESVDLVAANGIFNLSPDKDAVMREAARVLRPGGRTVFAEVVLKSDLPENVRQNIDDWFRCIGGALQKNNFLDRLKLNGLQYPKILWEGRNARTGHEAALCVVIRAQKS